MGDEVKHTLNLDVVLNPIEKVAESYKKETNGSKPFDKVPGAEAKYDQMYARSSELNSKKGGLTVQEINEIRKLYHSMISILISVAKETGVAAKEVLGATDALKAAQKALRENDARYNRSKMVSNSPNSKANLGGKAVTYGDIGFSKDGKTYGIKSALDKGFLTADNTSEVKYTKKYTDDYVAGQNLPNFGRKKVNTYDRLVEAAGSEGADPIYQKTLDEITAGQQEISQLINKEVSIRQGLVTKLQQEETNVEQVKQNNPSAVNQTISDLSVAEVAGDKEIASAKEDIVDTEHANEALAQATNQSTKALKEQKQGLGQVVKQFSIYAIALKTVKAALREATQTIAQLDKSLTEQAMVTGMTRQQSYALLSTYQDLSAQLGTTTKEVAESASEYMKQGKTIEETLVLTRAAISSAKVAGISASDSINYLTTALNGFQLSADQAMEVSDKFAAVAASSATDYDELAIALSKVASQANMAGMSIDYTTSLLATGLETTREAPETMGTALKTIIARMRELTDYGATLSGDTDINNVESQLNYIGIKLRDTNGELRSTEDVLDDLGKKWKDLNKNQQAAVAKALAGTRQQSRLIAMMDNYDRVLELQQISLDSAGATAAQMEKYLNGMEASLNNVRVAWEKIVTAVTDSDVIIGLVNGAANLLESIAKLLNNSAVTISGLVIISAALVTTAIKRYEIQKQHNLAILTENKATIENQILQKKLYVMLLKEYLKRLQTLQTDQKLTKEKAKQALLDENASNDAKAAAIIAEQQFQQSLEGADLDKQKKATMAEIALNEEEITGLEYQRLGVSSQMAQNQAGIVGSLSKYMNLLTPILSIMSLINIIQTGILASKKAEIVATKAANVEEGKGLALRVKSMFANMMTAPKTIPGLIAMGAVATGLAVALGVGIAAAFGAFKDKDEAAAESINNLSSEIYTLNKRANELSEVAEKFDEIDNKVLKTNADLKEMSTILSGASDKLSEEQQEVYNSLNTDSRKREYLDSVIKQTNEEVTQKRREQLNKINNLDSSQKGKFFNSTDGMWVTARDSVYAMNNANLYESINRMTNITSSETSAMKALGQRILENVSAEKALEIANSGLSSSFVDAIKTITVKAKDLDGNIKDTFAAEVLTSDDYSLTEKVAAYKKLSAALSGGELSSFLNSYNEYGVFSSLNDLTLDFIDNMGLSADKINDLWVAIQKLGGSTEQLQMFLSTLSNTSGDITTAIKATFEELKEDDFATLFNAYAKAVEVSVLDMGQNMDSFSNKISNIYETASKWSTMSNSDKTEFLSDNMDLFSGESGKKLLEAFEGGDYNTIMKALQGDDALEKLRQTRLKEIEQDLIIAEQREGTEDYNVAWVKQLKEWKAQLEDIEDVYQVSLETRLKQEQNALSEYKSYLNEQQDALTESLNKRKDAYQKYFDAINQQAEDEDYEEQADLLISNLNKLGSTTNASANSQRAELEDKLEELEKDRLDTLRQRAQEAIISNIDDQIGEISNKFDELLDNNRLMLAAMTGELGNNAGNLFANMISNKVMDGVTGNELSDYVQTLNSTYGYALGGTDLSQLEFTQSGNSLYLNVNGQTYELNTSDQQSLYNTIMTALRQLGLN